MSATAQVILEVLENAGPHGATWKELQVIVKKHHGVISGALSNLHSQKEVFYIKASREGCKVYVHKAFKVYFPAKARVDAPKKMRAHVLLTKIVDAFEGEADLRPLIEEAKALINE